MRYWGLMRDNGDHYASLWVLKTLIPAAEAFKGWA